MLVTSNFSFSHSVFKRLVLQTHENQGLFGKGLTATFQLSSEASLNYAASKWYIRDWVNPLADDKILGLSKLKAFADDKLNVTQTITVVFHRIENIVGKGENAGYRYFLLLPQCFQKAFFPPVHQKLSLCGKGLKNIVKSTGKGAPGNSKTYINLSSAASLNYAASKWYIRDLVNPIAYKKNLGLFKLKAFADEKLNVTLKVVFHRMENIVGKEENAGYQHFLLFPQCFQKVFILQCVKSCHCVVRG